MQRQQAEVKAADAEKARHAAELLAERAWFAEQEAEIEALVEQAQRLGRALTRTSHVLSDFLARQSSSVPVKPNCTSIAQTPGASSEDSVKPSSTWRRRSNYNRGAILRVTGWLRLRHENWEIRKKAQYHQDAASRDDNDSPEAIAVQALAMPYDERGIDLLSEAIDRQPFAPVFYFYRGRIAYDLAIRQGNRRFYRMAIDDLEGLARTTRAISPIVDAPPL